MGAAVAPALPSRAGPVEPAAAIPASQVLSDAGPLPTTAAPQPLAQSAGSLEVPGGPDANGPSPVAALAGGATTSSPMAASPPPSGPGARILVQWDPGATEAARAASLQALGGFRRELIHTAAMKTRGDGVMEVIELAQGANLNAVLAAYRTTAGVRSAEEDLFVRPQSVSNDYYYERGLLWGMYGSDNPAVAGPPGTTNAFGSQAEVAWNHGFTGSRTVAVGILDTGFDYTHPDLAANAWVNPYETADGIDNDGNGYIDDIRGWDFLSDDNSTYDDWEEDRHGTEVAGTIGAVGGNGIGVAGVSWEVSMISAKFLGQYGGFLSGAIQAMDYLTDLKWRHGINIVATNNSWNGGGYSQALQDAITRAAKQNILFIAAAGNSALNNDSLPSVSYPSTYDTTAAAGYDAVVSVAAITRTGELANFSNYGRATVDLAAPGAGIFSTVPWGDYDASSGSSMAAPHVTGAVALYAASHPTTLAPQIREALLASTTPTPSLQGKTVTGGRLNVADFLDIEPPPALSITAAQAFLAEGASDATTFAFEIRRHGSATEAITVDWQVAGRGANPADADDFVGQILPGGRVSLAPGVTSATLSVQVRGDRREESTEAFTVTLSNPSGGATLAGTSASASSLILNDDGVITATNPGAITIPSQGAARPSPSTVVVAGDSRLKVDSLEVTLYNFSHTSPGDIDILLVGPSGAKTLLMSDAGGSTGVEGITLSFSSQAQVSLPDGLALSSGTYLPTDWERDDTFNPAAPSGPYSADLSLFQGTNPNGVWSLFVQDDQAEASGAIFGGWSLSITPEPDPPVISLAVSPAAVAEDSGTNLQYTFTRTGPTTRALTVNYTVGGSALLGTDYAGITASLGQASVSFSPGSATASVTVRPIADRDMELDETVALTLAGGTGYTLGTIDPVVGTIQNDDYHVIEAIGAVRLLTDGRGWLYAQERDNPPSLITHSGAPVFQGGLDGLQFLGAEDVAGVNQLAARRPMSNRYVFYTLERNWQSLSKLLEIVPNTSRYIRQEISFFQDFNQDGFIGAGDVFASSAAPDPSSPFQAPALQPLSLRVAAGRI